MAKALTAAAIIREFEDSVSLVPQSRGRPEALNTEAGRHLLIRWVVRAQLVEWQLGHARLRQLFQDSAGPDSPYTFEQRLRMTIQSGLHELSSLARQRVRQITGRVDSTVPPIEPREWLDEDMAIGLKSPLIPREFWDRILSCQSLDLSDYALRIEEKTELFRTASRTEAMIFALGYLKRHGTDPWTRISYEPENVFLSLDFPPESETREYKATFRADSRSGQKNPHQQHSCLRTIAGFLNSKGGTLICGIDDRRQVLGLDADFALIHGADKADYFCQIAHEAIKQHLRPWPAGKVSVQVVPCANSAVAVFRVEESGQRVLLEGVHYIRDGNRTVRLTDREVDLAQDSKTSGKKS